MKRILIAVSLILGGTYAAAAGEDPIYTSWTSSKAVGGYDTVAYFKEGKPVKGSKKFKTKYMDAEWRFSSQENLDLFLADPAKYAPQYGGYCAWAMGGAENGTRGFTASGDPEIWKIVDGKLYLNYDKSVAKKWNVDIPGFIEKADRFYPETVDLEE
ncbi:YHS domain-containing (seleno)protein [Kordiimonas aquimaris]|uniref:YHS domain-containing (seleno)protein n=1 Tax=Kordiimonas aquimaris TaxID=707591 RepID=UPI00374CDFD2